MSDYAHGLLFVTVCTVLTACSTSEPGSESHHSGRFTKLYDKPLTYAQAKEKSIDFPFPPSAHNIQYGIYGLWQAYAKVVRFNAPVEDCIRHIDTVLAWDDTNHNRTSSYPRISVTNVEPVDAGFPTTIPWFTPDKINRGIHAGSKGSHTPQIWVDLDKGTVYFRETD